MKIDVDVFTMDGSYYEYEYDHVVFLKKKKKRKEYDRVYLNIYAYMWLSKQNDDYAYTS